MQAPAPPNSVYFFTGYAVAVNANIRRDSKILTDPKDRFFSTNAVSCLGVSGGSSSASSPGVKFREPLISIDSADTAVSGDYQDRDEAARYTHSNWEQNRLPTVSSASANVYGLEIVNEGPDSRHILKVAHTSFELTAVNLRNSNQPSIVVNPSISKVTIDGRELNVNLAGPEFLEIDTLDLLSAYYNQGGSFFKRYGHCFFPQDSAEPSEYPASRLPMNHGATYCTVVESIEWADGSKSVPGVTITGNRVKVDGFGTILFGEMMVSAYAKSISMVRFFLGSPQGGEGDAGTGGINGGGWPP